MPMSCWPAACRKKRKASRPTWRRASSTFRRRSIRPAMRARDSEIICDLARRLGRGQYFPFHEPREIFEELRLASRGGIADYYGITYEKIDRADGRLLALPDARPSRHAAAVRRRPLLPSRRQGALHEPGVARQRRSGGRGISRSISRPAAWSASTSPARRRGASARWSINIPSPSWRFIRGWRSSTESQTGDWVTITTRRTEITLQAMVVRTIRPDTVFIPYHWPGERSANRLTHRTLDPRSKIPEYKVSACRIEKAPAPQRRPRANVRHGILRRSFALHRLPVLPEGLRGVRHASRRFDDQLRFRGPRRRPSPPRPTSAGTATIPRARRSVPPTRSRNTRTALSARR